MTVYNSDLFIDPEFRIGIGEVKHGCQWQDQSTVQKVKDVSGSLFRTAIVSTASWLLADGLALPIVVTLFAPEVAASVVIITVAIVAVAVLGAYAIAYKNASQIEGVASVERETDDPALGEFRPNRVFYTEKSDESMELKLRLVREAKHSIELSGSYCGGEIFDRFLVEVKQQLEKEPQLKVRILTASKLLTESNREKIERLSREHAGRFCVVETAQEVVLTPTVRTVENHTKLLIIDEAICVTGGTGVQDNLSREEMNAGGEETFTGGLLGKGARDMDMVVEGPLAITMRQQFYQLMDKWHRYAQHRTGVVHGGISDEPNGRDLVTKYNRVDVSDCTEADREMRRERLFKGIARDRQLEEVSSAMIVGSNEHGSRHGCKQAYLKMIESAQSTILIGNMCLSEPDVVRALADARRRGVEVKIVTNGSGADSSMGSSMLNYVSRDYYSELLSAGVEIYEYAKPQTLYHKKLMIIDDEMTALGSYNISSHCSTTEDEDIVVTISSEAAAVARKSFQEDLTNARQIDPDFFSGAVGSFRKVTTSLRKRVLWQFVGYTFQ